MKSGNIVAAAGLMGVLLASPLFAAVEAEQGGKVPPDISRGSSATPQEYSVPPVNPKSLKPSDDHPFANKDVVNLKGEKLGTIQHVMVDTVGGKETYAMLYLDGGKDQYVPVPINFLKEGEAGLILNASKEQLMKGPNFGGRGKSEDFEHLGGEALKPNLRQGGGN
jgi:hypothetical protein